MKLLLWNRLCLCERVLKCAQYSDISVPLRELIDQLAGEAALCAQDQEKFWEFHDWLFANQRTMNRESMVAAAGELGVDVEVFEGCIDEGTYRARVLGDLNEARSFGITGTPGFLINGRVVKGAQPIEDFEVIIDDELQRQGIDVPPKQAAAEE